MLPADVLDVLFAAPRYCFSDHTLLAIAAIQKAGKQVMLAAVIRSPHIPFEQF